jgi:glycerol uptake facilitator-like aquaporin
MTLARRLVGEGLGTALLLVAVVGSGIMAERLSGGNAAIALLANSLATAGALVALIVTFAPVSGAHFNPAVTVARTFTNTFTGIGQGDVPGFLLAQGTAVVVAVPLFAWILRERPKGSE